MGRTQGEGAWFGSGRLPWAEGRTREERGEHHATEADAAVGEEVPPRAAQCGCGLPM